MNFKDLLEQEHQKLNTLLVEKVDSRSTFDQLMEIANEFEGDIDRLYIQMASENKLGQNPKSYTEYNTPQGIYSYPLGWVLDEVGDPLNLPFGFEREYIHVFQQLGNILDSRTYSENDLNQDTQILVESHQEELERVYRLDDTDQPFDDWIDDLITAFERKAIIRSSLGRLWNITRNLAYLRAALRGGQLIVSWNKILRETLIYDCILDYGSKVIHGNEPVQAVHLDYRSILQIETLININRESLKKDKQQQKQITLNDLLESIEFSFEQGSYSMLYDLLNKYGWDFEDEVIFEPLRDNVSGLVEEKAYKEIEEVTNTILLSTTITQKLLKEEKKTFIEEMLEKEIETTDDIRELLENMKSNLYYLLTDDGLDLYQRVTSEDFLEDLKDQFGNQSRAAFTYNKMIDDVVKPYPIVDPNEI